MDDRGSREREERDRREEAVERQSVSVKFGTIGVRKGKEGELRDGW